MWKGPAEHALSRCRLSTAPPDHAPAQLPRRQTRPCSWQQCLAAVGICDRTPAGPRHESHARRRLRWPLAKRQGAGAQRNRHALRSRRCAVAARLVVRTIQRHARFTLAETPQSRLVGSSASSLHGWSRASHGCARTLRCSARVATTSGPRASGRMSLSGLQDAQLRAAAAERSCG